MLGGPRAPGIGFAIGEDRLILTLQAQHEQHAQQEHEAAAAQVVTTPPPTTKDCHPDPGRSEGKGPASRSWTPTKLDAYIAPLGPALNAAALALARELRAAGLSVEVGDGTFRLKKSFETADHLARHILILGEDELASSILTVKTFRTGEQNKVPRADLISALRC